MIHHVFYIPTRLRNFHGPSELQGARFGPDTRPGLTERPVKSVEEVLEYMKEVGNGSTVSVGKDGASLG